MAENDFQIITFYEFKDLAAVDGLPDLKRSLVDAMRCDEIYGTIILAGEGFNATVSGAPNCILSFIHAAEKIFETRLSYRSSFHADKPFQRIKVKIKPEIVSLRTPVEIGRGIGTHVGPEKWNEIIRDPDVVILDTRNDYEFKVGTFRNAINPATKKFSDLPAFVSENLDPDKHKKVAMFCTGGIRCEKFAPYMKGRGFAEVYQLEGGILKYLENIPVAESLWEGECFVFDERITVDESLRQGTAQDLSVAPNAEK